MQQCTMPAHAQCTLTRTPARTTTAELHGALALVAKSKSALTSTMLAVWGKWEPRRVYLEGGDICALARIRAPQARPKKWCHCSARFEIWRQVCIQTKYYALEIAASCTLRVVMKRAWACNLASHAKISNSGPCGYGNFGTYGSIFLSLLLLLCLLLWHLICSFHLIIVFKTPFLRSLYENTSWTSTRF